MEVAAISPVEPALTRRLSDGPTGPVLEKGESSAHRPAPAPPLQRLGSRFQVLDGLDEAQDFCQSIASLKHKIQEV